ncbi:phosphopantetheine-binding protein [Streptomyces sp. GD-15H]|uniref:acyl carrier protein n=1 Tax=Streptomyces sp. GD-15H TaxID=3129112 RepID=UPI0032519AD1
MNHDFVRTRIRQFLEPQLGGEPLADSDDFFALGYVNSLFAMQLVAFLEREFELTLGPADMDFDNFRTVDGLVGFVASKAPASA